MIRIWLLCALFSVACPAMAEIIPVQIGETDDATRIMLPLPEDAEWTVETESRRVRIEVSGASGFAMSESNTLRPDSRVAGASGGLTPDVLNIGLACTCDAQSYVVGGRFLTIDISQPIPQPDRLQLPDVLADLMQPWHQPLHFPPDPSRHDAVEGPRLPEDTLDAEFSTGLAQAAYQGFVELREEQAPPSQTDISAEILENIAIGVDAQLQTITGNSADLPDPLTFSCSEVSAALNTAWADEDSLSIQIGTARRDAVSDNQDIDKAAMRNLALVLVGHGFGHEAKAVLRNFGDQSDLSKAITYIAEVIDDPETPEQIGMETCDENLAFWSFLNDPSAVGPDIDPRRLLITYKLFPPMLQKRLETPFADALVQAGYGGFQPELQNFRNTAMAFTHTNPDTPAPRIDLESAAPERDILRADLTATDLNPSVATPRSPNTLPLSLLETLRLERRDTAGELVLLDEVLARHVAQGSYFAVLNLLADSATRLDGDVVEDLTQRHLSASVRAMTDPELIAFAFRETLPVMPQDIAGLVRARLEALDIAPPPAFADAPPADLGEERHTSEPTTSRSLNLPDIGRTPPGDIPTVEQSESLLSSSAEMRNAIETFIADTQR